MDDQKQPNNQLTNQPKTEQPDVSSSAPVEMEPSTDTSGQPTPPASQPSAMPTPPMAPEPPTMPVTPPTEPTAPMGTEPKRKNSMVIVLIAVVLIVVLALVGLLVYQMIK
ncbi:MAG TPA: hypothetical protein VIQ80_03155 [Candidatus Saccharimonadales bacterium]